MLFAQPARTWGRFAENYRCCCPLPLHGRGLRDLCSCVGLREDDGAVWYLPPQISKLRISIVSNEGDGNMVWAANSFTTFIARRCH